LEAFTASYGTSGGHDVRAGLHTATFGEETLVLDRQVIPIDPEVPLEVAALIGCAVTTGVGAALNTARVESDATVAVIGCGGVGLSVIQGARLAGASRILAIDRVAARLEMAVRLGATDVHDSSLMDPVEPILSLTKGGADHVFEVVGDGETIRQAFHMTRPGGTTTLVGEPPSDSEVSLPGMALVSGGRRILGCVYGSSDPDRDFPRYLDLWRSGDLKLSEMVTRRISLGEINDAVRAMEAGEGVRSLITF
jgi:S-(hydroxymethyl)glutathione dehydrogenase/alcohol dehydrogenase